MTLAAINGHDGLYKQKNANVNNPFPEDGRVGLRNWTPNPARKQRRGPQILLLDY